MELEREQELEQERERELEQEREQEREREQGRCEVKKIQTSITEQKRRHPEHDMQCVFFAACSSIRECRWMHAIPNASPGNTISQVWLSREGRRAGVLDVFLPYSVLKPGDCINEFHGLYIEFKTEKGRLTEEQAEFINYVTSSGYAVAICRSAQAGVDAVLLYLRGVHSNDDAIREALLKIKK